MRKKRLLATTVILFILAAGFGYLAIFKAPPLGAKAALSRSTALVGDRLRYSVNVISDKNITFEIPDVEKKLSNLGKDKEFRVLDKGSSERIFLGKKRAVRWYTLSQHNTGEHVIPPVEIKYKRKGGPEESVTTNESALTIKSVVSKEEAKKPPTITIGGGLAGGGAGGEAGPSRGADVDAPIWFRIIDKAGPLNLITPTDIAIICSAGAIAVLLLLLVVRFMKRRKRKIPELPPHELAIMRLEELKAKELPKKGLFKEFYFELSHILRAFIKSTFEMGPEELTTSEFLNKVNETSLITDRQKKDFAGLAELSDFVKFSGYRPAETELASSFELTKSTIDRIYEATRPPETEKART